MSEEQARPLHTADLSQQQNVGIAQESRKYHLMLKPQDPNLLGTAISQIWVFVFLTIIFRDLHEMSTATTLRGILQGTYEENPVTETGLLVGGFVLILMLLTALLSNFLHPVYVRRLNLIVPPSALVGGLYLFPNDPDDYLLGGATTLAQATILFLSWRWTPTPNPGLPHVS